MSQFPTELHKGKPCSPLAENALLGCLLGGGFTPAEDAWRRVTESGLTPDWFHMPAARTLYELLRRARGEGREIDPVAMAAFSLETATLLPPVFIADCYTAGGAFPGQALETLRNYRDARELDDAADRIREAVRGDLTEIGAARAAVLERLLAGGPAEARAVSGTDALFACMDRMEMQNASGDPPGVPTGLAMLDAKTGGIVPGLTLIGAETSGGKSVLALQFLMALLRAGKRVLFYTLEMTVDMNMRRMLCCLSGIPFRRLVSPVPPFTEGELADFLRAGKEFGRFAHLLTIRDGDLTAAELVTDARSRNAAQKIDAVVCDYMQILTPDDPRATPEQQITAASARLRGLAVELGIPVITPVQLNDASKVRGSRMPANDAELFLRIIHERDENDQPAEPDEHGRRRCGLWIEKNRNGERWFLIPAVLDGARMRLTECDSGDA